MSLKNAIIISHHIGTYDDAPEGILTAWVDLDFGGYVQGFGGYRLRLSDAASKWIDGLLRVTATTRMDRIIGKPVRAELDSAGNIARLYHFLDDKIAFYPAAEFHNPEEKKE